MDSENISKHIPHALAGLAAMILLYKGYRAMQTETIMGHGEGFKDIIQTIDGVVVKNIEETTLQTLHSEPAAKESIHQLRYLTYSHLGVFRKK